jgi:hypothetical protein
MSGAISKTVHDHRNLSSPTLDQFAIGLALGLIVFGGCKSRAQCHLCIVIIPQQEAR